MIQWDLEKTLTLLTFAGSSDKFYMSLAIIYSKEAGTDLSTF